MIEVDATLFSLLLESSALFALILLGLTLTNWRRRTRMRRTLRALVAQINAEAGTRLQSAREKAGAAAGDADAGDDVGARLNLTERGICQRLISAVARRDPALLAQTYAELKQLVDAYQALLAERSAPAEASAEQQQAVAARDAAMRTLKSDYEKSTRELAITQRTMEKMLREYSSMFSGGADDDVDQVALMEQMKQAAAEELAAAVEPGEADEEGILDIDLDIAPDDDDNAEPGQAAADTSAARGR